MTKKKLLKNLSWLFADNIIRIFGSLIIGIWVARYLGPKNYGVLNYAIAFTSLYIIFVKLGLDQIIVREIVKTPDQKKYLLGTAFYLKLFGSIIAFICIWLSLIIIETESLTKGVILLIAGGFVFQSFDVIDFFYQGKVLSKYVVIARNSSFLLISLLKIYLIIYKYSVVYFGLAATIEILCSSILLVLIYKRNGESIRQWRFSSKTAIALLKSSWPLAISTFLISVHMRIDQVMIGNMLSTKDVGVYSVAVRLSQFWIFVPGIIVSTLRPYFIRIRESSKTLYHIRFIQLYSVMFWMGVLVGVVTIVIGQNVIEFLFGAEYKYAYRALVFNIWNGIFISQALARGIWMISENLQKYRLYNNILVVVLNITVNIILIPKIGITGAALATLITQALGTWGFSFFWRPLRASTLDMLKSVNPMYIISIWR